MNLLDSLIGYCQCAILAIFVLIISPVWGNDALALFNNRSINVDLYDPTYSNGILETHNGGVITSNDIRLQAKHIVYTHASHEASEPRTTVIAEGEVRLEFHGQLLIGRKLEYNFLTRTGFLYGATTGIFPWFFGSRLIQLCSDGSYILHNGFISTSEACDPEWQIAIDTAVIYPNHDIKAHNLSVRLLDWPIFWLPSLNTNIDTLSNTPVTYSMRWGGRQGSRLGMSYQFLSWGPWRGLVRIDYNLKRGLGGGVEGHYRHPDRHERFDCINYLANDSSLADLHMHTRYRFQGHYLRSWNEGGTLFDLTYDKLSDQEMATDYNDRGIELDIAGRSQITVHHSQKYWIGNLAIRPRINSFQTIKQELPGLSFTLHPWTFYHFISGCNTQAAYLDFSYAHGLANVRDFTAIRCEIQPYIYLPLHLGPFQVTARADYVGIFYGNTPQRTDAWLSAGVMRCDGQFFCYRNYENVRHSIRPYFSYLYTTAPSLSPKEHFIFDIDDGWYRVNALRYGIQNVLLERSTTSSFTLDTYLWNFFDHERGTPIPRATADLAFSCLACIDTNLEVTWDLQHSELMRLNFKTAWTINHNAAISLEYRQRSAFDWRKVDHENFTLDFFRREDALLHSAVSDRRRTLLLHFYWRLRYDTALEWESRLGWDRRCERSYLEFDFNIERALAASWKMKLAYQHKEYDDRIAIYFSLAIAHPKSKPKPTVSYTGL